MNTSIQMYGAKIQIYSAQTQICGPSGDTPGGLLRAQGGRRNKDFRVLYQQKNTESKNKQTTKQTNKQTCGLG